MRRWVWRLATGVLGVALPTLLGCAITVHKRGESTQIAGLPGPDDHSEIAAAAPTGSLPWPERLPVWSGLKRSTLERYAARPMGVVQRIEGPISSARPGDRAAEQLDQELLADGRTLIGRMRGGGREPFITVTSEGKGAILYYPVPKSEAGDVSVPIQGRAAILLKFISAVREPTPPDARVLQLAGERNDKPLQPTTLRIQRTWFAYYDPAASWQKANPGTFARGTVVLLPGMFGTPRDLIDETVHRLRNRGWAVVRMLAQPSRFTERAEFSVDAAEVDSVAAKVGALLQDRAAECAYAVQAACLYVLQERPQLEAAPRVALGMSGGAMVLPTVVAREPSRYAGAVSIAGGADFLAIAIESNYAAWIDALVFTWRPPDARDETIARLEAAYRRNAPLDPLSTARLMAGRPVLMIHGSSDRAVPSKYGDELWEAYGRPERWVIDGGHEWVFLTMPYHLNRMLEWMDSAFPASSAPAAPQP